jgi:hypothetical protein
MVVKLLYSPSFHAAIYFLAYFPSLRENVGNNCNTTMLCACELFYKFEISYESSNCYGNLYDYYAIPGYTN